MFMKKLVSLLFALTLCASLAAPALATEGVDPGPTSGAEPGDEIASSVDPSIAPTDAPETAPLAPAASDPETPADTGETDPNDTGTETAETAETDMPLVVSFSDVPTTHTFYKGITYCASKGIVGGYADGTFRPNSGVTREQLAAMLWRSAGSPASSRVLNFTDADRAGDYALPALRWAVERGVMNGKSGGVLDPQGQATRAQTAQMLKNLIKN